MGASTSVVHALRRYVRRTYHALLDRFAKEPDLYCPRCTSCGEDGCCAAECCDNGPGCRGYYGNRDQRHELIGERKGWDRCYDRMNVSELREVAQKARVALDSCGEPWDEIDALRAAVERYEAKENAITGDA